MKTVLTTLGISLLVLAGCAGQKQAESNFIQENIDNAVAQETIQTDIIEKSGKILNPRTIDKDGNIVYVPIDDWCSGFFSGNIWHMYELTGDRKWLPLAEKYTELRVRKSTNRSSYRRPNPCLPVSALLQAYFSRGMQTRDGRLNVAGNVPLSLII